MHSSPYNVAEDIVNKKVCSKCDEEKKLTEFSWRNKAAHKTIATCKDCYNEYRREYYLLNKAAEKQRVCDRRDKRSDDVFKYLQSHPCVDCGEDDPIVLQFDHVKGKKVAAVSRLVSDGVSWKSVLKEIAKCEIRCANCHIRKTAKQFQWKQRK